MDIGLTEISAIVLAIGALGAAAYGVVEAFGKASASSQWIIVDAAVGEIAPKRRMSTLGSRFRGLPYVGFAAVQDFMRPLSPALKIAYGPDYQKIVLGHYRNGRAAGEAPGAIRQGVRMGITLLGEDQIQYVLAGNWGLSSEASARLANSISQRNASLMAAETPTSDAQAESLMATFVTVLDARLDAAFSVAEERYQSSARTWAAAAAVALVIGLNFVAISTEPAAALSWPVALFIGAVAVPLAPMAKDLAKALSEAVGAFRAFGVGR